MRNEVPEGGFLFRVEVHDYNPQGSVLKWPADQDPEGRGLLLVDALCQRWGHLPKRTGGKFVYADIPALGPEAER